MSRFGFAFKVLAPVALGVLLAACGATPPPPSSDGPVADWPLWGGSEGGSRYSPLTQVTPQNVGRLKKAWTYHIGMIDAPEQSSPTFEGTPIVAGRVAISMGAFKFAAWISSTFRPCASTISAATI